MTDFTASRPHLYVAGSVIFASYHTDNENAIFSQFNAAINETTGHEHSGTTGDGPILPATSVSIEDSVYLPPIGSIIPFYDFGAALTYDTTVWKLCNGQTTNVDGVSQTLPDLSNRYLVGFGTEGGVDIGSAAWATAPVGEAGHTVNIEHTHTGPSHSHTFTGNSVTTGASSTAYTGDAGDTYTSWTGTLTTGSPSSASTGSDGSHVHGLSSGHACVATRSGAVASGLGNTAIGTKSTTGWTAYLHWNVTSPTSTSATVSYGTPLGGTTDAASPSTHTHTISHTHNLASHRHQDALHNHTLAHTHNVTATGTVSLAGTGATGSSLSTTQTIQPRSIRVRYIMRVV